MRGHPIFFSNLIIASLFWPSVSSSSKYEKYNETREVTCQDLDIPSKLTASAWLYKGGSQEGFVLSLFYDGTFRRSVVSDFSEVRTGVWGYKNTEGSVGLLFMLTKGNSPAVGVGSPQKEEVFLLRLVKDDLLLLGRYLLRPAGTPPPQTGQFRSSAIKGVVNEKNYPNYFHLTARDWSKSGTKDNDFVPDLLTLKRDGTFTSSYRKGECRHSGYWSLEGGQIFLELPPNHCDARGDINPVVRGHYYLFENGSLVLDREYKYSPSD